LSCFIRVTVFVFELKDNKTELSFDACSPAELYWMPHPKYETCPEVGLGVGDGEFGELYLGLGPLQAVKIKNKIKDKTAFIYGIILYFLKK
jgi:hypothetical protein